MLREHSFNTLSCFQTNPKRKMLFKVPTWPRDTSKAACNFIPCLATSKLLPKTV